MTALLRPALVSFAALTLITGVAYPTVVTAIARLAFAEQAEGSVIVRDGRAVGSTLIAQPFTGPKYFWPRPSAANYDGAAGAGSNLGPSNPALADAVADRVRTLRTTGQVTGEVPIDLVTASGSGLDPHVSVEAALVQVGRVARARAMSEADVRRAVEANVEGRTLGVLGEPRVNVLRLNLQLDAPERRAASANTAETAAVAGWRARGFMPEMN